MQHMFTLTALSAYRASFNDANRTSQEDAHTRQKMSPRRRFGKGLLLRREFAAETKAKRRLDLS